MKWEPYVIVFSIIGAVFVGPLLGIEAGKVMDARDQERAAYVRRVEKGRIILKACEARQGMPTFDTENFVIGCEERK